MTTNYPGALDTNTELRNDLIDATTTSGLHAPQSNNQSDAIRAIETELGVNPRGTFADVVARLDATATKTPSASQVFQGVNDVVPLISRLKTGGVANLYEAQGSTGTVLAYITRLGEISGQGLSIAGTPLAATHLSDTALLARLASPAFTGTPTAPTPSNGDSSTKIATTAFVASNGVPAGAIMAYGGSSAPTGWLLLDGSAVSRTTYSALFALYGTTYGVGDGSTTFNLPDLRGRTIVGKGTNADVSTLGNSDGLSVGSRTTKHYHGAGTFAVTTGGGHGHAHTLAIGASGSHTHGTDSQGSHSHSGSVTAGGHSSYSMSGALATAAVQGPGSYNMATNSHTHDISGGGSHGHGLSIDGVGGHSHNVTSATHSHINGDFTGAVGGSDGTHSHGTSGNVGTTAGVAETPAYLVLNYIVKT